MKAVPKLTLDEELAKLRWHAIYGASVVSMISHHVSSFCLTPTCFEMLNIVERAKEWADDAESAWKEIEKKS